MRIWHPAIAFCLLVAVRLPAGEIHQAVESGDSDKVRALLEASPELVNTRDGQGDTPLHIAARKSYSPVAKVLLEFGANANAVNSSRITPLKIAQGFGNQDMISLLQDRRFATASVQTAPRSPPAPGAVSRPPGPPAPVRPTGPALGLQTVGPDTEYTSVALNYGIRLPAGWKRMPKANQQTDVAVMNDTPPARSLAVVVMGDSSGAPARLDDRTIAGLEKGFFGDGRARKTSAKAIKMGGQPGYEMRGTIATPLGTGSLVARVVAADNQFYSLVANRMGGEVMNDPQIKQSLDSFRFLNPPRSTGSGGTSSAYARGYAIGRVVGTLVGIGIMVSVIVAITMFIVRKVSRR